MNTENGDLLESDDETVDQILDDSGFVDNLLQMRVMGRDGIASEVTLGVMKVQDAWYCTRIRPTETDGRRKMTRSTKSLRTALNKEIKRFLDEQGFNDDAPISSLKNLVAEGKRKPDESTEHS